jgi:hypothetical protein
LPVSSSQLLAQSESVVGETSSLTWAARGGACRWLQIAANITRSCVAYIVSEFVLTLIPAKTQVQAVGKARRCVAAGICRNSDLRLLTLISENKVGVGASTLTLNTSNDTIYFRRFRVCHATCVKFRHLHSVARLHLHSACNSATCRFCWACSGVARLHLHRTRRYATGNILAFV